MSSLHARRIECNDLRLLREAAAELSAGGVDLISFAQAHLHVDAGVAEDLEESLLGFGGRRAIRQAGDGIVWNDVQDRRATAEQFDQLPGMLGAIVQLAEQNVLERESAAVVGEETIGRGDDRGDRD